MCGKLTENVHKFHSDSVTSVCLALESMHIFAKNAFSVINHTSRRDNYIW